MIDRGYSVSELPGGSLRASRIDHIRDANGVRVVMLKGDVIGH